MTVADQFGPAKIYELVRPTRRCVPVSRDGDGLENPLVDLMCFMVKPAKGQPKHTPVASIDTAMSSGPSACSR